MAIIWADGFDHYGTTPNGGRDAMLSGAWAQFYSGNGAPAEVSATQSRTGDYSLKIRQQYGATGAMTVRRVLGAAKTVLGIAFGIYPDGLPSSNNLAGMEIRNGSNENIVRFALESDGSIGVYTGSVPTLIGTSDPVFTSDAWSHFEAKAVIDNVVGEVEIRANGNTIFHMTDLDLGTSAATQVKFGMFENFIEYTYYIDDVVAWDDTGANNNDFMGAQRVYALWPTSDTAVADWALTGVSSGYDAIDDLVPDGDTTHLTAENTNDTSEFGLGSLPPETAGIAGVYIPTMAKLTDAGTGEIVVSLVSGSSASDGPNTTLTASYTYWGGVHELDPDTGLPWTKEGLEAAILRLKRTV